MVEELCLSISSVQGFILLFGPLFSMNKLLYIQVLLACHALLQSRFRVLGSSRILFLLGDNLGVFYVWNSVFPFQEESISSLPNWTLILLTCLKQDPLAGGSTTPLYGDVFIGSSWSFEFLELESCFLVRFHSASCFYLVSVLLTVVGGYVADLATG